MGQRRNHWKVRLASFLDSSNVEGFVMPLAVNVFFVGLSSGPLVKVTVAAWENGVILQTITSVLTDETFLTQHRLAQLIVGVILVMLFLLSLDPMNRFSALLLGFTGFFYTLFIWEKGHVTLDPKDILFAPWTGWAVMLIGTCIGLVLATRHRRILQGRLNWNRLRVRMFFGFIILLVTLPPSVDYILFTSANPLWLFPVGMFLLVMHNTLRKRVNHQIVVIGPSRHGKTTFLLGLYGAREKKSEGELDFDVVDSEDPHPNESTDVPPEDDAHRASRVDEDQPPETVSSDGGADEAGQAYPKTSRNDGEESEHEEESFLSNRLVRSAGYLSRIAKQFREVQILQRLSIQNHPDPSDSLQEMWDALHKEEERGVVDLDRKRSLDEPQPGLYTQIAFNVVSKGFPKHQVHLHALDTDADQYNNVEDVVERYHGFLGWIRRIYDRIKEDLDEYGDARTEQNFKLRLARRLVAADSIVFVYKSDYLLSGTPEVPEEGSDSSEDVSIDAMSILGQLDKTGLAKNYVLAVTKIDRIQDEDEAISEVESRVRNRLEAGIPGADFPPEMDFDSICPVYFDIDGENEPGEDPDRHGFRSALDVMIEGYE